MANLCVDTTGHPRTSSSLPMTPPATCSGIRTASFRDIASERLVTQPDVVTGEARRAVRQVGEHGGDDLLGCRRTGNRVVELLDLATLQEQPSQRGRVRQPEHEAQHVDARAVQLGPQRLGHHHVEGLRRAVGHHVRAADEPGADDTSTMAPRPALHRPGEVMAHAQSRDAVALHHGHGVLDRLRTDAP